MRHLLERASYSTIRLFWPMFLVTAVACVVWSVRSVRRRSSGRPLVKVGTSTAVLITVAAPLLTFVLAGADFAYHDDDVLLPHSVAHRFFPIAIWPQQGRYFPLFSQEFNAISLVSTAPLAYYGFIALQLIVFCILLDMVLSDVAVWWRAVATALILYASGTAIVFAEAVYPERNIVFWLLVMIMALKRFDLRPSRLNMAAALLSAQIAMYYKEPVFLLVAGVAIIRLASALRGTGRLSRRSLSSRPLEIGLLGIAVIFAGQLLALLLGSGSSQYVDNGSVGSVSAAALYFRMDPLLIVFVAGIVIRLVRRRQAPYLDPVWDAFAVGGVVYFLALVATGLATDRYLGPVDMIAVLFTIRQGSALWAERPRVRGWTLAAALVVTLTTLSGGAFRLIEHTSVVSGTAELADFVSDYTSTHEGTLRLYFPSTQDWRIMNFAERLQYRHPEAIERVQFTSPLSFSDGLCVWWTPYKCEHSSGPQPGDMVIRLPDDRERDEKADESRRTLFEYSWLPVEVPSVVGRIFYPEEPLYTSGATMPRRWLVASAELQGG